MGWLAAPVCPSFFSARQPRCLLHTIGIVVTIVGPSHCDEAALAVVVITCCVQGASIRFFFFLLKIVSISSFVTII